MGKDSVIFKGLSKGSLTMLQWIYGQHKLDLIFFSFSSSFLRGRRSRVWEDWKESVHMVHDVKSPNSQ